MTRVAIQKIIVVASEDKGRGRRKNRIVLKNKMATPKREFKTPPMNKPALKKGQKKKVPPSTPAHVLASESDSESEKGLGLISTGKRISRRKTLAVDVNKRILVLRPGDDPVARLNMTQREYQEFLLLLSSDERYFQSSGAGAGPDVIDGIPSTFRDDTAAASIVMTPGVAAASHLLSGPAELTSSVSRRSKKPSSAAPLGTKSNRLHRISGPLSVNEAESMRGPSVVSRYLEYDADSDDEQFVRSLSEPTSLSLKKGSSSMRKGPTAMTIAVVSPDGMAMSPSLLSIGCFEHMVAILERQLEVSKIFLRENIRADLQCSVTKALMNDGDKVVGQTAVFLQEAEGGRRAGLAALKKAHELTLSTEAARCRQTTARRAAGQVLADLPFTTAIASSAATSSVDGMLVELSGGDLTGLSFPAPAVHQLLGTVAKGGRSPRARQSSPKPAGSSSSTGTGAIFTCEHLRFLVSQETALQLLSQVYLAWHLSTATAGADIGQQGEAGLKGKIKKDPSGHAEAERDSSHAPPAQVSQPVLEMLSRVYHYWTNKRAGLAVSLLRCYHNFMMDMWHQEPSMPPLPEDTNIDKLKETHKQLHTIRHDLDQARLIVDRVRRREKLKKELMSTAGDHFDRLVELVQLIHTAGKKAAGTAKSAPVSNAQWRDVAMLAKSCRYSLQDDAEGCQGDDSGSEEAKRGSTTNESAASAPCKEMASSSARLKRSRTALCKEAEQSEALSKKARREPRGDSFNDVSVLGGKSAKGAPSDQRNAMSAMTAHRRPKRENCRPLPRSRAPISRQGRRSVFDFHSTSSEGSDGDSDSAVRSGGSESVCT